jgi:hypothetical protein
MGKMQIGAKIGGLGELFAAATKLPNPGLFLDTCHQASIAGVGLDSSKRSE